MSICKTDRDGGRRVGLYLLIPGVGKQIWPAHPANELVEPSPLSGKTEGCLLPDAPKSCEAFNLSCDWDDSIVTQPKETKIGGSSKETIFLYFYFFLKRMEHDCADLENKVNNQSAHLFLFE